MPLNEYKTYRKKNNGRVEISYKPIAKSNQETKDILSTLNDKIEQIENNFNFLFDKTNVSLDGNIQNVNDIMDKLNYIEDENNKLTNIISVYDSSLRDKISHIQNNLNSKIENINRYNKECKEEQDTFLSLIEDIKITQEETQERLEKYKSLSNDVTTIKNKCSLLGSSILEIKKQDFKNKYSELKSKIESIEKITKSYNDLYTRLSNKVKHIESIEKRHQVGRQKINTEMDSLKKNNEEMMEGLKKHTTKIDTYILDMKKFKHDIKSQILVVEKGVQNTLDITDKLTKEYNEKITNINDDIYKLREKELKGIRMEIEIIKGKLNESELLSDDKYENIKTKLSKLDNLLDIKENVNAELVRLETDFSSNLEELKHKHKRTEETVVELGDSHITLSSEMKELRKKQKQTEETVVELGDSHITLSSNLKELNQKEDILSSRVDGINERMNGLSENQEVLSSTMDGVSEKQTVLSSTVNGINEKQSVLSSTLNGLSEKHEVLSFTLNGINQRNEERDEILNGLSKKQDESNDIVNRTNERQNVLSSTLDGLNEKQNKTDERINRINEKQVELSSTVNGINEKQVELSSTVDGINEKQCEIDERMNGMNEKQEVLSSTMDGVSEKQNETNKRINGLNEKQELLSSTVNELSEKQYTNSSSMNDIDMLYKENIEIRSNIQDLSKNIYDDISNQKNTLLDCNQRMSDINTKIVAYDNSLNTLTTTVYENKEISNELRDTLSKVKTNYEELSSKWGSIQERNIILQERIKEIENNKYNIEPQIELLKDEVKELCNSYFVELNSKVDELIEFRNKVIEEDISKKHVDELREKITMLVHKMENYESNQVIIPEIQEIEKDNSINIGPLVEDIDKIKVQIEDINKTLVEKDISNTNITSKVVFLEKEMLDINDKIKQINIDNNRTNKDRRSNSSELIGVLSNKIKEVINDMNELKVSSYRYEMIEDYINKVNDSLKEYVKKGEIERLIDLKGLKNKIEILNQEVKVNMETSNQLNEKLTYYDISFISLENELTNTREERNQSMEYIQETIELLKTQIEELDETFKNGNEENRHQSILIEERLNELSNHIQESKEFKSSFLLELQKIEKELSQKLNKKHEDYDSKIKEFKSILDIERTNIENIDKKINNYVNENTKFQSSLEELKKELSSRNKTLTKENVINCDSDTILELVNGTIHGLKEDMDLELSTVKQYVRKLYEDIKKTMNDEIGKIEGKIREKGSTDITKDINDLKENCNETSYKISEILVRIDSLQENTRLEENYEELKKITENKIDISELEKVKNNLFDTLNKYKKDVKDELESKIDTLDIENKIADIHSKIQEVADISTTLEGHFKTIHSELQSNNANVSRHMKEWEEFKITINEFKDMISEKYSVLSDNYIDITKDILRLQNDYKEKFDTVYSDILETVNKGNEDNETSLNKIKNMLSFLERNNGELKKQVSELYSKLETYDKMKENANDDIFKTINELKSEYEKLEKEEPKKYRFIESEIDSIKKDILSINQSLHIDIPRHIKEICKEDTTQKKKNKFNLLFRKNKSTSSNLSFDESNDIEREHENESEIKKLHSIIESLSREIQTLKSNKKIDTEQIMFIIKYNLDKFKKEFKKDKDDVYDKFNTKEERLMEMERRLRSNSKLGVLHDMESSLKEKTEVLDKVVNKEEDLSQDEKYRILEEKNSILMKEIEEMKQQFKQLNRTVSLLKLN